MEDVKVREMQIFDYKKKIAEAETKLKQQQNLYEAVRSDRNLYSKNLIESQVGVPSSDKLFHCIARYRQISSAENQPDDTIKPDGCWGMGISIYWLKLKDEA